MPIKEHESNLIDLGLKDKFLKVVSIYGVNASGKSNLCLALDNFKKLVEESLNSAKEKEDLAVSKYYMPLRKEKIPSWNWFGFTTTMNINMGLNITAKELRPNGSIRRIRKPTGTLQYSKGLWKRFNLVHL